jgi:cytochrome c-type biogenesis protein CcmH/NrfG
MTRFSLAVSFLFVFTLSLQAQNGESKQDSARAHLAAAMGQLQQKHSEQAIPELEAAVADDPGLADAQANLGVLYYFHHAFEKAQPHLAAAVALKPDVAKLRALLGLAEVFTHQQEKGYADLQQSLAALKGEKIQREVGETLLQIDTGKGDLEDAAHVAAVLLESNPADPQLLLTLFKLHSQLANNAVVSMALTAPESAELHVAMAEELARHGQDENAIANYHDALRLKPSMPGVHLELGNLYYNSADTRQQSLAAGEYAAAIQQNAGDESAWRMQGRDAARRGDMKAAAQSLEHALQLAPDDAEACAELAKVLMEVKNTDRAEKLLLHAIEIDPTDETTHYRLAMLYRQQGRGEDAKREIAVYQKIRETKNRLRSVFRDMRLKMDEKGSEEGGMAN